MRMPIDFNDELLNKIFEAIVSHGTWKKACDAISAGDDEYKGLPHYRTFNKFLAKNVMGPEQRARYEEACKIGAKVLVDEAISIADDSSHDTIVTSKNKEIPNTEWMSRSKLRVESRLKIAALLDPERFGAALKPMERRIRLPAPEDDSTQGKLNVIYSQLTKGKLSPSEALTCANVVNLQAQAIDLALVKQEIENLKGSPNNQRLCSSTV